MIRQFDFLLNRLASRYCSSVVGMSANAVSDCNEKLSKRAQKRLLRKRLYNAAKTDDTEKKHEDIKKNKKIVTAPEADLILEKCLNEAEYYFENGLRKVYPYYYDFTAYAKGRWFGCRLVDVFVKEFQNYTAERFMKAVESENIQVKGKPATADHVIQNGDFILNRVHRHELPVSAESPTILVDNEDFLVVNKPSSIPIHPCGRYRHNTLLYILGKEHGFRNLRTIYRLDRLTSGLVIFCKTEVKTKELMKCMSQRLFQKEYLCKVEGQFPSEIIECDQPIGPLSQKYGIYKVDGKGKPSKTTFERIGYDGHMSIVKCRPLTGRTHQIRVHLQYLGFPIVNDPLYKGPEWGPHCGKLGDFGKTDEELISDLVAVHTSTLYLDMQDGIEDIVSLMPPEDGGCSDNVTSAFSSTSKQSEEEEVNGEPPAKRPRTSDSDAPDIGAVTDISTGKGFDSTKFVVDADCRECKLKYVEPTQEQLVMFLHAFKYKGPGWEFSTPIPAWATGAEVSQP